jgi:hypothetical protein
MEASFLFLGTGYDSFDRVTVSKKEKNDSVFTLRWQGLVISQKALGSWFSHFLSELPVLDRLCVLLGL